LVVPVWVTFVAVAQYSGVLMKRVGARVMMASGMALMGGGLLLLTAISPTTSRIAIEAALVVIGVGLGMNTGPVNAVAVANVPAARPGTQHRAHDGGDARHRRARRDLRGACRRRDARRDDHRAQARVPRRRDRRAVGHGHRARLHARRLDAAAPSLTVGTKHEGRARAGLRLFHSDA